jgi:hypothetical protein
MLVLLAAMAAVALGSACDEEPSRPPVLAQGNGHPGVSGGSGSNIEAGALDAGDAGDGGVCTDLANDGAVIDQTLVNDALPRGTGGTLTDGVYTITEARVYQATGVPGLTGTSVQGSIRLTGQGQIFERVLKSTTPSTASFEVRTRGSLSPSGSPGVGTIVLECPNARQEEVAYTATDTSLTISNLVTNELFIFTKIL